MICVYESTATDFSSNGLGAVTPMSCSVTETLNGEWELTLVHPIDENRKWLRMTEGRMERTAREEDETAGEDYPEPSDCAD